MSQPTNRLDFLVTATAAVVVATGSLVACGGSSAEASVNLTWQISADDKFAVLVNSGKLMTAAGTSFTAKVDATGLTAGSTYFYRFIDEAGVVSPAGTTRTLPAPGVASVKFAVFSCALYSEGFFNAYDAAGKSDAQYAVHLGNYLYEYGSDPAKFGNKDAITLGRVTVHAKMPWITVWDDHEFANNTYVTGAENHNTATQGDWTTRKSIAARAPRVDADPHARRQQPAEDLPPL